MHQYYCNKVLFDIIVSIFKIIIKKYYSHNILNVSVLLQISHYSIEDVSSGRLHLLYMIIYDYLTLVSMCSPFAIIYNIVYSFISSMITYKTTHTYIIHAYMRYITLLHKSTYNKLQINYFCLFDNKIIQFVTFDIL